MELQRIRGRRRAGAVAAVATVGLLAAVTPPSHAAPGSGDASRSGTYIVTLKPGTKSTSGAGKDVAEKYDARIQRTYSAALNGYAVRATAAEARRLAADPSVADVVADRKIHVDLGARAAAPQAAARQPNPPSWGLDRIDQKNLPLDKSYTAPRTKGAGVTVYVIDTGVRTSHKDFGGRARSGWDFIGNDPVAQDANGHGTHVAGTVAGTKYGVAKKAKIVAVRVLDSEGGGTLAGIIAGVDWVTRNARKPAVANMSIGTPAFAPLDAAVRKSVASGVTYSVAAGNESEPATNSSPARVKEALTVGASDRRDKRPSFSNYGSRLDLFAPGVAIKSASNTSNTATATYSGTSMAAPHVAGVAALYLADHRTAKPAKVGKWLTDRSAKNKLSGIGAGSPNRLLQVK
ncbi:S8 family peptidase [Streptomyces sp. NRRL B-1347]|uniref:S8 family peptidase n=1 Tax=Streptomyces sp. NRRL B-1347 TaxID=1476877 RepID=UPI0004CBECB3|nr:S8 family peptidase [Streptomyces sp. NRRL B-1347]